MANKVYQLRSATLAALSGCRPDRKPVAKRVNIVALLPLVEPAGYKLATDGWHESAKYLKNSVDVAHSGDVGALRQTDRNGRQPVSPL